MDSRNRPVWRVLAADRAVSRCGRVVAACAVLAATRSSQATIVERVVAVVGDRAILLSELKQRARPGEFQLQRQVADAASRAVAVHELRRQTLDRMVDEILELQVARRVGISVSPEEVERGIELQARANGITRQQLEQEVLANGLTLAEYQHEIRSQLLSARLVNMHGQGRSAPVGDDDLRAAYRRLQLEERRQLPIRVAGIRIAIAPPAGPDHVEAARGLARSLMTHAESEQSFSALANRYSSDAASRDSGGLLHVSRSMELPQEMAQAIDSATPGDVVGPIRVGDAFWILSLRERRDSSLPTFEASKGQLAAQVQTELFMHARTKWLEGLRRREHVQIRL
jgi:peptidyl-prolyl cis-trans isomerase SurA